MASDVKWIKITTDIFDDEKILLIESLPDAYAIITVWFKLLCLAGKQNNSGVFMMGKIAYTDKMLATIFRMKETTVQLALQTFEQFGMVEIIDGVITIPNWNKHQSLDSYEKKKERDRLYMRERRAAQKALVAGSNTPATELPLEDWKKVLIEFGYQCAYCGKTEGLEQEHIVPVKFGGKYELGNIVPACRHCNASKGDRGLVDWYSTSDAFDPERLRHILEYAKSHDKSSNESSDKSSYVAVSEEEKEREKEIDIDIKREKTDFQSVVDLYHKICVSFPSVRSLSDARKKAIKARLNTYTPDDFKTVFENAEASSFLKGSNDRNWSANFDWLIADKNMAKVLEGNYADKPKPAPKTGRKEIVPHWMERDGRKEEFAADVRKNVQAMRERKALEERVERLKESLR